MQLNEQEKMALRTQIEEIESLSKIKLIGVIKTAKDFQKTFGTQFIDMIACGALNSVENFVYRDMFFHKGLVVFVDGAGSGRGGYIGGVDYRRLMAHHVAYFSVTKELLSNKLIDMDNLLADIDFNTISRTASTDAGSKELHMRCRLPQILVINDLSLKAVQSHRTHQKEPGVSQNSIFMEWIANFIDEMLGIRLQDGKITIITLADDVQTIKNVGEVLGTRVKSMLRFLSPNVFDYDTVSSEQCCRICLVTKELASIEAFPSQFIDRIKSAFSLMGESDERIGIAMRKFIDMADQMGVETSSVFDKMSDEIANCVRFGEAGKKAALTIMNLMERSPEVLIALKGRK